MNSPLAALLFDMDGTLVDSQASIEAVWFEFADRHGVDRAVVAQALPGRIASDIIVRVLGNRANVEDQGIRGTDCCCHPDHVRHT